MQDYPCTAEPCKIGFLRKRDGCISACSLMLCRSGRAGILRIIPCVLAKKSYPAETILEPIGDFPAAMMVQYRGCITDLAHRGMGNGLHA